MNSALDHVRALPSMEPLFAAAHHADVVSVASDATPRSFLAAAFYYKPWWLRILYSLRSVVAKLMGLRHEPQRNKYKPEDVPLEPGQAFAFLTVAAAEEGSFWAGVVDDKHLEAHLIAAKQIIPGQGARMHLCTLVRHKHWSGRVYFALILPFHYLIVRSMARYAARTANTPAP